MRISFDIGFCLALLLSLPAAASANDMSQPDHGFFYTNEVVEDMPWSIHVIKFERARRDFEFCTTLGEGNVIGMGTVSDQVKSSCLARTAGSAPGGDQRGFLREKGERRRPPARSANSLWRSGELPGRPRLFLDCPGRHASHDQRFIAFPGDLARRDNDPDRVEPNPGGRCRSSFYVAVWRHDAERRGSGTGVGTRDEFGLAPAESGSAICWSRPRGARGAGNTALSPEIMVLSIGPEPRGAGAVCPAGGDRAESLRETVPDLTGVNMAMWRRPGAVAGRQTDENGRIDQIPASARAAVGWNERSCCLMVEVDGRQANLSIGMTFPELADYMAKIGCDQAMNLDGGGSATLWAFGMVKNSPS